MESENKIRMEIADGRTRFYQWDSGQHLIVYDGGICNEVHFANAGGQEALVCRIWEQDGLRLADVPDVLLQNPGAIKAYACTSGADGGKTQHSQYFMVLERSKPEDYIYTETEVRTYGKLEERIITLENMDGVNPETIEAGVQKYMEENPISAESIGALSVELLPEAVNDALAQAKASGEFHGEKGEPGERGPQGVKGEPGEQGLRGTDGYTPVKGTDYYTEAEKEEFKVYISTELAKRGQLAPVYAESIEDCTDVAKLYVLPDGYIYAYTSKQVFSKTNEYNPDTTKLNYRVNSSGAETTYNGALLLPLIEVEMVSPYIVRVSGITIQATFGAYASVTYYDANNTRLGQTAWDGTPMYTLENGVYSFDLYDGGYPTAKYVRMWLGIGGSTAITAEDLSDLDVEFVPKSVNETVTDWQSTGHAFVPADYEDRIVSLENAVLKIQSENGSEVTIPSFWDNAILECITKIKALQVGRNCITFPFFSDNHQRNGYAGALIRRIMDECNIPFCFYGGDSISSGYIESETVMIAQDKAFDAMMKKAIPNGRFCRAVGNHDGYWNVSAETGDENHYTREEVYELFLREESLAQNKYFGGDGTYYYVDDIASKVRFIVLNTNGGSVDAAQITWLQNTALHFTESGWAVVFISHQPITNNFHSNISNAQEVQNILAAYIDGTDESKADIVGWFSGHIHRDRIYQCDATGNTNADDTATVSLPWKTVTITSDHTGISYEDATKHTVANDDLSHAIDFVTINKTTRTVNLTRLGIGNDRSFTY